MVWQIMCLSHQYRFDNNANIVGHGIVNANILKVPSIVLCFITVG